MPESGIVLPRMIIVIQVVFGEPLRDQREFRGSDVEALTAVDIGRGNYHPPLLRLLEMKWLRATYSRQSARGSSGGKPSTTLYQRTPIGEKGYEALQQRLGKYGIRLE
jgi:hypothetical protein